MVTIVGVSGSTRRASFNASLLRALAAAVPHDASVNIESIAAIPLYNGARRARSCHARVQQQHPRRREERDRLVLAIAGASPGRFGTVLSQKAWLPVFRTLGANLYTGRLLVSRAGSVFDANGNITDATVSDSVARFMAGFVEFIRA
jgi:NAD(P)H-dependent FMN reductase